MLPLKNGTLLKTDTDGKTEAFCVAVGYTVEGTVEGKNEPFTEEDGRIVAGIHSRVEEGVMVMTVVTPAEEYPADGMTVVK